MRNFEDIIIDYGWARTKEARTPHVKPLLSICAEQQI